MAKKQAANGSFAKPKGCFSQISNEVLRDDTLSLKAKGLYSLIVSYITLPDFTLYKDYLQAQCAEGRYSFDSAWKELVESGYLAHNRTRLPDGTFYYEYSLLTPALPKKEAAIKVAKKEILPTTKVEIKPSASDCPLEKNQTPALPIVYKTINNNTKSVLSDKDWGVAIKPEKSTRKDMDKQIDYDYFLREDFFKGPKQLVITQLVDYLCCLKAQAVKGELVEGLEGEMLLQLIESVDSCTLCEFLVHMGEREPQRVRFPVAYWNKAFINYLKEEAYGLALISS